jgi:C-terminal processing protease CtpA/Prc
MITDRSGFLIRFFRSTIIIALFAFVSCDDDDEPSVTFVDEGNRHVNDWIQENMEYWYLWSNELPASPNKDLKPDSFFQSLLTDDDRFSWIQENYQELLNSLKGISKEAGFEFVLYQEEGSSNVLAQILYIKPGSPAENAGLKRGDAISHVNGAQLNTSNYKSVLDDIKDNAFNITYKPLVVEEQRFDIPKTISLSTVTYAENPNYFSKIIEANGKTIGYYVYNFFAAGTDDQPEKYDAEMESIFAGFQAKGITDLVLDLRFNSGGSEVSANNLASLIAPSPDNKIFFRREYNTRVENEIIADPEAGESFLLSKLKHKAQNIGGQLSGRVYVLTGSRTASASELIVNGLKPYMQVFLIGDVTYGKNVGSISLYDKDDSKNTWGMQPIVVKVYNSLDQSDYSQGFAPDIEDKDNDLYIYPLGDLREGLLSRAVEEITGVPSPGRKGITEKKKIVGHSLDSKRRSFLLNIENPNEQ